ncbi:MAG: polymorphic toxin-type HINT domain-containing protein [Myxococcota bacterium]
MDAHRSTSTSSATATPTPTLLELAAREWDEARALSEPLGTAWSEAGDALLFPSNYRALSSASVAARMALEGMASHQREARAYHLGVDPAQSTDNERVRREGQQKLAESLDAQRPQWNTKVEQTPLGATNLIPPGALESIDAIFTRVSEGAWQLAFDAERIRLLATAISPIRPPFAPEGLDPLREYNADNPAMAAVSNLLLAMRGRFGHEWLFLFEESKRAGLPAWAASDIGNEIAGAATYEANLQDQGKLTIDPDKIDRLARSVRRAADGWGTKESQLTIAEIRNLARPEREELERIYMIRYGIPLVVQLDLELGGEDDDEVFGSLSGDPVRAAIAALENRIDDGICDPDEIVAVLRQIPVSERGRFQQMRKSDPKLMDIERRIHEARYRNDSALTRDDDRRDREMLDAWFGAGRAKAEAISLEESAIDAHHFDQGDHLQASLTAKHVQVGDHRVPAADMKRLIAALDQSEDPRTLEAAFNQSHPYTLRQWIAQCGERAQQDLAYALLDKTKEQVEQHERSAEEIAARVIAGSGDEVLAALSDPDLSSSDPKRGQAAVKRREEANEVFAKRYGHPWEKVGGEAGKDAMSGHLKRRFDDDEEDQALHVLKSGRKSDAIAAWQAIYIRGTDESALKEIFRGKSKSEMDALRRDYYLYAGRSLDWDVDDETWDGGEDAFDLETLMLGEPETEEEMREYAKKRQERYRGGGTGQTITDGVEENLFYGHSGQDADRQYQMIESLFDPATGKLRPGVDPAALRRVYGWHTGAIEDHQAAKSMVINAIARGVEIVVAALATVLSGGGAAPWLVAALAAVAGVATKAALSGPSTTLATVGVDVVVGLASVAMAGIGARLLAGGKDAGQGVRSIAVMSEEAAAVGGAVFREQVIRKAVALMVENAGNGAVQQALSDGTWDKGLSAGFLAVFTAALRDAGVSLVTLDLAPQAFQSKAGNFLLQTGTQWIVQGSADVEATSFVVHSVLRAGATVAQWSTDRRAAEHQARLEGARKQAAEMHTDAKVRVKDAMRAELERQLANPNLSETAKERLRAWVDHYEVRDLAYDTSSGAAAPDAVDTASAPAATATSKGSSTAKPSSCFVPGTPVHTPEGTRAIEALQRGDRVIALRATPQGIIAKECSILDLLVRQVPNLLKITISGTLIEVSPEHPFWVPGSGWVEAGELSVGNTLLSIRGEMLEIEQIERVEGRFTVHNIEVDELHTYCVGGLGVLVHNKAWAANTHTQALSNLDRAKKLPTTHPDQAEILEKALQHERMALEAEETDQPTPAAMQDAITSLGSHIEQVEQIVALPANVKQLKAELLVAKSDAMALPNMHRYLVVEVTNIEGSLNALEALAHSGDLSLVDDYQEQKKNYLAIRNTITSLMPKPSAPPSPLARWLEKARWDPHDGKHTRARTEDEAKQMSTPTDRERDPPGQYLPGIDNRALELEALQKGKVIRGFPNGTEGTVYVVHTFNDYIGYSLGELVKSIRAEISGGINAPSYHGHPRKF